MSIRAVKTRLERKRRGTVASKDQTDWLGWRLVVRTSLLKFLSCSSCSLQPQLESLATTNADSGLTADLHRHILYLSRIEAARRHAARAHQFRRSALLSTFLSIIMRDALVAQEHPTAARRETANRRFKVSAPLLTSQTQLTSHRHDRPS